MKEDKNNKIADNSFEKKEEKRVVKESSHLELEKIKSAIDKEKSYISLLDNINDKCVTINKGFNRCLEMLSLSIRGPETNRTIDEIISNNLASIASINETLESEKENAKNRLNDLYYKKDNFEAERRK